MFLGFPCGSAGKESSCNAGDLGSIPGLERSPGEGEVYRLQYSGLENSMDYIVHGVAKSWTWLSDFDSLTHSHAIEVMLKIIQTRLQHYENWEHPDVQARLRKGRGTRDQIANIHWIIDKAKEFQKSIHLSFIHYAKTFDCVIKNWKTLREMVIPDHLTCLLRNLYADQEAS